MTLSSDEANKEWVILIISKTKSYKNVFSVINC